MWSDLPDLPDGTDVSDRDVCATPHVRPEHADLHCHRTDVRRESTDLCRGDVRSVADVQAERSGLCAHVRPGESGVHADDVSAGPDLQWELDLQHRRSALHPDLRHGESGLCADDVPAGPDLQYEPA